MALIELLASSPAVFTGTCLVVGLALGSFLNVVIYRLPLMLERQWREQCAEVSGAAAAVTLSVALPERFNLLVPRSICPACRAPIGVLQNIPLLSWLVLRGRCASCGTPISVRYPLVEGLTGDSLGAGRLEVRLRLAGARRAHPHLVPDRAHLHRHRSSAAARQPDAAATVARAVAEPVGAAAWRPRSGRRALEPHRGHCGLREPVERLSSLPATHR